MEKLGSSALLDNQSEPQSPCGAVTEECQDSAGCAVIQGPHRVHTPHHTGTHNSRSSQLRARRRDQVPGGWGPGSGSLVTSPSLLPSPPSPPSTPALHFCTPFSLDVHFNLIFKHIIWNTLKWPVLADYILLKRQFYGVQTVWGARKGISGEEDRATPYLPEMTL